MLRVAIVDDERLARQRLKSAITGIDGVETVAEATNAEDAVAAIAHTDPAVVLLDIEMPEGDGFEVVTRLLDLATLPEIIFVTAFDRYAVTAFERGAIDYLMKPVAFERLEAALRRAEQRIRLRNAHERAERLQHVVNTMRISPSPRAPAADTGIWFRNGDERIRIFPEEIRYASADRDYVEIVTLRKTLYFRSTITALATRLGPEGFIRVHRSHVVRKAAIRALRRLGHGKSELELDGGTVLPVGASYFADVSALIEA